jgi:hypothetical protein
LNYVEDKEGKITYLLKYKNRNEIKKKKSVWRPACLHNPTVTLKFLAFEDTENRTLCPWFAKQLKGREREQGMVGILRVKLAAKLLGIAWTLMKNKEMFAYEKLNNC